MKFSQWLEASGLSFGPPYNLSYRQKYAAWLGGRDLARRIVDELSRVGEILNRPEEADLARYANKLQDLARLVPSCADLVERLSNIWHHRLVPAMTSTSPLGREKADGYVQAFEYYLHQIKLRLGHETEIA